MKRLAAALVTLVASVQTFAGVMEIPQPVPPPVIPLVEVIINGLLALLPIV